MGWLDRGSRSIRGDKIESRAKSLSVERDRHAYRVGRQIWIIGSNDNRSNFGPREQSAPLAHRSVQWCPWPTIA